MHFCDIPEGDIGVDFSVCRTLQGFIITGGALSPVCIMFIAVTQSWVRLEKMLMMRQKHGSICIKEVLYVFSGCVRKETGASRSVQSMVMKDGGWKNEPEIPLAVTFPCVSNIDSTVYLLDRDGNMKLLQMDIDTRVWQELASCPVAICYE